MCRQPCSLRCTACVADRAMKSALCGVGRYIQHSAVLCPALLDIYVSRNVGYMSELEEARLPHKLDELASCPAEDIVRALRRDHRRESTGDCFPCHVCVQADSVKLVD